MSVAEPGILSHGLSRHFDSVVAIDISEPMLAIARARRAIPNIDYRHENANHLALNQMFNCIVSHSTFHHLEDVSETLRTLKASLEPRGRLILIDNACRWPLIPRNACTSTAKTCLKFAPNLFRHGPRSAWRIFRFYTSRHWLDHVKSDQILSRARFPQRLCGGPAPCHVHSVEILHGSGLAGARPSCRRIK